ncbi:MAG: hypothetical protein JETCAE02_19020 [Anaerolineaceae bacterium]|jgi:hypothetical protein|nr:hypothetical protein [Anaerolineales bacterium]NOG74624.1 hypothetical protein [Chloroflexota bacterium]GER79875.1 hypothetical protein DIM_19560 [Candidatus Denitrolinea symbiosum]GJQ39490.1 MAG: hypothetical protein JETCAE02_19020 [Anaerolineaceae bacterium]MCL4822774.1 hypothetical protein [Anaerolineales bacterium]
MINFGFGMGELAVILINVILLLGVPLAIIVLLVRIYQKLKNIEERLKDK